MMCSIAGDGRSKLLLVSRKYLCRDSNCRDDSLAKWIDSQHSMFNVFDVDHEKGTNFGHKLRNTTMVRVHPGY
jgi:hypothetical protein